MDLLFNLLNVAVYLLILVGTALHHRRALHVKIMLTAFVCDLALLLAVELSNSALAQAMRSVSGEVVEGRTITIIHVAFAVSALAMWFVQIVVGRKILKGRMDLLHRHAIGAKIFLILRLGNVVTAWMV